MLFRSEFAELNFDFHPKAIRGWLNDLGFVIEKTLTLSHFRVGFLKRALPTRVLVFCDSIFQWTGALWQLSPSVFVRAKAAGPRIKELPVDIVGLFKCPDCGYSPLMNKKGHLECSSCKKKWEVKDGIFDFRESK